MLFYRRQYVGALKENPHFCAADLWKTRTIGWAQGRIILFASPPPLFTSQAKKERRP
jgi:hypothetical protein